MKSKKSFFSLAIILNDIKRFWWISAIYALLLFLVSPLTVLKIDVERYIYHENIIDFDMIMGGAWLLLALMPVMIGVMTFRYMQNTKSVTVIHSMPYTRLQLYVSNSLAGLILLLLPILLNYAILAGIGGFTDYGLVFEPNIVTQWLQVHVLISIALYAVTIAIGMFTGSSIAQIIFTYIYNFLIIGILWGVGQILVGNILGFSGFSDGMLTNVAKFFPITQLFLLLSNDITIANLAVIDVLMFLAIWVIGYFVYRYRNLEDAGDVISNDILKPIFRYGVTICVMIAGVVYVKYLFYTESPNFLIYLIFALIGYVIAEMLLRKSFKVWNSYKGFIGFVGAFAIVVLMISLDMFGYEKYIPEMSEIQMAFISENDNNIETFIEVGYRKSAGIGVLTEENIKLVTDLHQKIVTDSSFKYSEDGNTFMIGYLLKNGSIVKRVYSGNIENYKDEIKKIQSTKEFRESTNEIFNITESNLKGVEVKNEITNKGLTLNDPAVTKEILKLAKNTVYSREDIEDYSGRYGVEFIFESPENKNQAIAETTISNYRSFYFTFGNEDTLLKDFLLNNGCGTIFTDYSNVQSIRMTKLDEEVNNRKVISDYMMIQSVIARIDALNDECTAEDIYRVELQVNGGETSDMAGDTLTVHKRLYGDESFDIFYLN